MNSSLSRCLTIGDVSVKVESSDQSFIDDLTVKYQHFLDQAPNQIAARIHVTHQTFLSRSDILVTQSDGIYDIDGGEFKGHLDLNSKITSATMRAEISVFDSFLRVFYSILLTQYDGFLVHSAGLKKDQNAYLFAGPSSSGKTTTAIRAKDFSVLNDELTLVRKVEDTFYLFSTPFAGAYDQTIERLSAPLKEIFFLDKQLSEAFVSVDKIQCLVQLLENVFFFDSSLDANQRILNLCHQAASEVGAFKINVLSRDNLWELVNDIEQKYCCA